MSARSGVVPGSRLAHAMAALLMAGLVACSGDTLYDESTGDVPGPDVRIVDPTEGTALAGRPVRVIVQATDSLGVSEIEISYRGVATGTITRSYSPPLTTATHDTVIQLPVTGTGELELRASSRNGLGGLGNSPPVVLVVVGEDDSAPRLSLEVTTPERMELQDTIRVRVNARDNTNGSGLVRVGLTVLATSPGRTDTLVVERVTDFPSPRRDAVQVDFQLPPPGVAAQDLPRTLNLEYYAFAIDSAGNCAVAVSGTEQSLPCGPLRPGSSAIVAGTDGAQATTIAVAGNSVRLQDGAIVPDAVVDVQRQRLYLPSLDRSRIEVLNIPTRTFGPSVLVGSEPWGVALNRTSDSLIVANSGGTNISYVPLSAGTLNEAVNRRIRTPNSVIFIVKQSDDANNTKRLDARFVDFSDRPQFIAQDAFGRLLYSTKPTDAAPNGTLRIVEHQGGWQQPEVKLLLSDLRTTPDSTTVTIAHIDSMRVFLRTTSDDVVELYDHMPGFPNQILRTGQVPLAEAIDSLIALGSDIVWAPGILDLQITGLRDTTYVAASGDRRRIAFGEGAGAPGRIIMWNAQTATISNEITVADLVGNSSEAITGIALNEDGTLNAARGRLGAYFFKEDLRLQGVSATPMTAAGSGAQLHPTHPSYAGFPNSSTSTLAFVAAGDVIRIVDTVHFTARGEIPVRNRITGPLRVSPPMPGDTGACPGPDCVIAKLYGVSDAGTVILVNVRSRDLTN